MKNPTATPMPNLIDRGTSRTMSSRMPKTDSSTKTVPEMNTIPMPTCHDTMPPLTSVNAKNALLPIAGASENGRFAYTPMNSEKTPDISAVTTIDAPRSIPAPEAIQTGWMTRMYAIVMKVVSPARTSRRKVLPRSVILK